jgi:hypothetical protein
MVASRHTSVAPLRTGCGPADHRRTMRASDRDREDTLEISSSARSSAIATSAPLRFAALPSSEVHARVVLGNITVRPPKLRTRIRGAAARL